MPTCGATQGRMVHRKVEHQDVGTEASSKNVFEQLAAERTAMAQLYEAIKTAGKGANTHGENIIALDGRLEGQTRMRLDVHRLHIGATNQARTGVEDPKGTQTKTADYVDAQHKAIFTGLEKKLQGVRGKVGETVTLLVEAKLVSSKSALDTTRTTEDEMEAYIIEVGKVRPDEGEIVSATFSQLKEDIAGLKASQQQKAAATAGLFSATAAGTSGLAITGLLGEHVSMLNTVKAQVEARVAAEQSRPRHCSDDGTDTPC